MSESEQRIHRVFRFIKISQNLKKSTKDKKETLDDERRQEYFRRSISLQKNTVFRIACQEKKSSSDLSVEERFFTIEKPELSMKTRGFLGSFRFYFPISE
jgi:hypothetical protein